MKDKIYPRLSSGIKRRLRMIINQTALLNLNNIKLMNEHIQWLLVNKNQLEKFSVNEIQDGTSMGETGFYNC